MCQMLSIGKRSGSLLLLLLQSHVVSLHDRALSLVDGWQTMISESVLDLMQWFPESCQFLVHFCLSARRLCASITDFKPFPLRTEIPPDSFYDITVYSIDSEIFQVFSIFTFKNIILKHLRAISVVSTLNYLLLKATRKQRPWKQSHTTKASETK